ncbi:MAG TPA: four helix bundle protein [Spirochaetia bacterium]|nr:four helix bundle protein [Spirochaetia bacterium]HRZ89939.1 four helix bundle protein [Spirochaetia bacterium]
MPEAPIQRLKVYQLAHALTLDLYRATRGFPADEKFGLTSQIRRAASSINANLMEGSHRRSRLDFASFIGIARGSCAELTYHLILARDLGYLNETDFRRYSERMYILGSMLCGLYKKVKK